MNGFRGVHEFTVQGKSVGFKFGQYAVAIACHECKCSASELFKRMGFNGGNNESDLLVLLNFFYAAAVNYCESKRMVVDFNAADVSDWIEEIGLDDCKSMLISSLTPISAKNSQAPETGRPQTIGQ